MPLVIAQGGIHLVRLRDRCWRFWSMSAFKVSESGPWPVFRPAGGEQVTWFRSICAYLRVNEEQVLMLMREGKEMVGAFPTRVC